MAYAQESPLNAHVDVTSGARGINPGLSLQLYLYFAYASSEGSGESVHMHRLA